MTELITNCQVCGCKDDSGYCKECLLNEKLELEHWESLTSNDDSDDPT